MIMNLAMRSFVILKSVFSGRMGQEIIFYEEMELFNKVGPEEIECSQADREGDGQDIS